MDTLGHCSRKPSVETLMFEDDDDNIDILDTGNVRLIPNSEGVHQEKTIKTIHISDTRLSIVKISKENGDDVKASAHELDSEERESVEGVLAGASPGERNEKADAVHPTHSSSSHTPPPSPPPPLPSSSPFSSFSLPNIAKDNSDIYI